MYRKIDPNNIRPKNYKDLEPAPELAMHYLANHRIYDEIRSAFRKGYIDKQQLLTLRGQVRSGNDNGAWKGLGRLLTHG